MKQKKSMERISSKLWKERKRLGLTQVQLASLAGLSQTTISRLEGGYSGLMLSSLLKVVRALGGVLIIKPVE